MCDRNDLEDTASYVSRAQLRVYVACSLTSEDRTGTGLRDYLLEQVGRAFREAGFSVHDPSAYTKPGSPHHSREVTAFDHLQAMRSDLIFFIRVQPSLGMGIEAHIAADTLIPWADAKVSKGFLKLAPLLGGLPNPSAGFRLCFDVEKVEGLISQLRDFLKGDAFRKRLQDVRRAKAVASAVIERIGIGHAIRRQRLLLNMSAEELAELVDLEPWWIRSIEADPDLAVCLSFMQLMRLVDAARLRFAADAPGSGQLAFPRLEPVDAFSPQLVQAADAFLQYSLRPHLCGEPPPDNDEQMLAHWRAWLSESKGLKLQLSPKRSQIRVGKLTAFLALPVSNITAEEKIKLDRVIAAVRRAFERMSDVSLHVAKPDYVSTARDEHGAEMYLATLRRLSQCDFAVALARPPATGVGIMTRLFANATLPCLGLAERGKPISRMLRGMYCRWIDEIIEYVSTDEASAQVEEVLGKHIKSLCEAAARRQVVRERIIRTTVANAVDRFRIPRGQGSEEVIRQLKTVPFVRGEWLDALARDPAILQTATLLQFVHIARELGWGIGVSSSGVPCLVPPHHLPDGKEERVLGERYVEVAEESLGNLIHARDTANQRLSSPVDDETLFDEWDDYCRQLATREAADLAEAPHIRSPSEWLETLLRSQPSASATAAGPTSQKVLPGMEGYVAHDEKEPEQGTSGVGDAALFLMRIAKHGLPTCAIARAVGQPLENVERALSAELESGAVRSDDGIWTVAKECDGPPPMNATRLLHRAIGFLLTSLECDKEAAFGRRLLRSAFLLGSAGKPLPAILAARLYVLQGNLRKAWNLAREQIKGFEDHESKEYVESLIVLGRAASTFEEAAGYLDEAVEICERALGGDGHNPGWTELAARTKLARGIASKDAGQGKPGFHLSRAAELWNVVGNELGRSVAEWHLLLSEDKNRVLKKHQARLERESPVIRVEAVRLYKARAASPTQPVLAQRNELTYAQCEQFIREAKLKHFGKSGTE